jgi:Ankyrin repeat
MLNDKKLRMAPYRWVQVKMKLLTNAVLIIYYTVIIIILHDNRQVVCQISGRTPLHCAARNARYDATKRLLQVFVVLNTFDDCGLPELMFWTRAYVVAKNKIHKYFIFAECRPTQGTIRANNHQANGPHCTCGSLLARVKKLRIRKYECPLSKLPSE